MSSGPCTDAGPELGRRLVAWYRSAQRPLPWRQVDDPYAILVAEMMLQQTQVETVIPYWHRFLRRFPTFAALAAASEAEVLRLWEGLGYYRRARYLHETARRVSRSGGLPGSVEELQQLPGIGPYTAAAVASIAFNRPAVAMDGNAARVAARLFAVDEVTTSASTRRRLSARLAAAIPPAEAGDFTQGLMELGSQVCRPRQPACHRCPLTQDCRAYQTGRQADLPRTSTRAAPTPVERVAAAIRWQEGLLLYRRPAQGLLGRLWALPDGRRHDDEAADAAVCRVLGDAFDLAVTVEKACGQIRHRFSHREWTVRLFLCEAVPGDVASLPALAGDADGGPAGAPQPARQGHTLWRVKKTTVQRLAMGGPDRKLLRRLTGEAGIP